MKVCKCDHKMKAVKKEYKKGGKTPAWTRSGVRTLKAASIARV